MNDHKLIPLLCKNDKGLPKLFLQFASSYDSDKFIWQTGFFPHKFTYLIHMKDKSILNN